MEIQCVKGMHRLKLVSCENNSGIKGLIEIAVNLMFTPVLKLG